MKKTDNANLKNKKKGGILEHERTEYLILDNVGFEVTEAFRNFKASLSVSIPKKSGKATSIIITSSCPEDGKTTVAVNLAMMIALSNAKVILIDADIRKGRVSNFFKVKNTPGLVDYLSGQASLDDVTHKSELNDNISFMASGTRTPRPYELLESEEMKSLLQELKGLYDYIILDTPPLVVVSDALALTSEVNGTIVVCRHESSYVKDIANTLDKLKFAKANVLGVVVNDYNNTKAKSSYHYNRYNQYNKYYLSDEE